MFDVIVIGGRPGGATVSAFVAMQGHRVLLLERERFPKYQIGESLLPATVRHTPDITASQDGLSWCEYEQVPNKPL